MEDLITLKSFSLNETGHVEFTLVLSDQISTEDINTITLKNKDTEVKDILVNRDFIVNSNELTLNTLSSKYIDEINGHFSVNDINFIIVELNEDKIQEILFRIGSNECTLKYRTVILPLYDLTPLRVKALRLYENSISCTCEFSKEFIDAILKIEALELALKLRDIDAVERLLNALTGSTISKIKGCGCNGR